MKNRKVSILAIIGIGLIVCSFCLVAALHICMEQGSRQSQKAAEQISALLPEKTPGIAEVYSDAQMPVMEIDGVDYVGLLEVPAFGICAAIADEWNGKSLFPAVGRAWGSAYDGSLVIGGSDYPGQLAFCAEVELGTQITVTDMTGARFSYTVSRVDRAKSAEAQWLANGDFALTLFCRNTYAMEYIAVRCNP